jgi:hypothetical protein
MRFPILFPILVLAVAPAAMAQTGAQSTTTANGSSLTGCVKGSKDQYYLVEKNVHRHTLMAKQDLSPLR